MIVVTFKLSREELVELERVAARLGWSRSEVIRQALRRYLAELERLERLQRAPIQVRVIEVF